MFMHHILTLAMPSAAAEILARICLKLRAVLSSALTLSLGVS